MIKPIAAALSGVALAACAATPSAPEPWAEHHPAAGNDSASLREPVALQAAGEVIDHADCAGHNGPFVADYDGDGKRDLGVGDIRGHFHLYRNTGTNQEPIYAAGQIIEVNGEVAKLPSW